MNVQETNTTPTTDTTALRENLRLPSSFDDDLLTRLLKSAYSYVERHTGVALRDKDVIITYPKQVSYPLLYKPTGTVVVKVNDVATTNFEYYYNFVRITDEVLETDIVEISYSVLASTDEEIVNAAIMVASSLYNNPEGNSETDFKRLNNYLRSVSRI